ncbi:GWxTD domain-containing protein [candidate division KSB1 bacterium]|nr:GWxTD domain-containing protein [candidate division KSB1 bacterium]
MKREHKFSAILTLTLCLLGFAALLRAQPNGEPQVDFQHPYYDFDFATFSVKGQESTRIEIYIQFSNVEFQFIRKNGGYKSNAEISIIVENKEKDFFREKYHKQQLIAHNYNETISAVVSRVIQFDFILPVDTYDFTARVIDTETKRVSIQKFKLTLPKYAADKLAISNIELCQRIDFANSNHDKELGFYKNGRWVVPKPSREYGVDENNMGLYFEVYGLQYGPENPDGSFLVQYTISDKQGDIKSEKTHRVNKPGKVAAISLNASIESLLTGKYNLTVTIFDEQLRKQSFQTTSFFRWSNKIDPNNEKIAYSIDALKFLADSKELDKLKKVSPDNISAALKDFWKSKDPTPYTETNEALIDFFNRFTIVNNTFGSKSTPGWKTDQGEIFMKYGVPGVVYKDKDALNMTKSEMWVYPNGEYFVFVDKYGFGDFRLLRNLSSR